MKIATLSLLSVIFALCFVSMSSASTPGDSPVNTDSSLSRLEDSLKDPDSILDKIKAVFRGSPASAATTPEELANETIIVVEGIQGVKQSLYEVIQGNVDALRELKRKIEESEDPSQIYDEAINELTAITEVFEKTAENRDRIENYLWKSTTNLSKLKTTPTKEIERLEQKKAELEKELRTPDSDDAAIVEMKRKALSQTIKYLTKQIEIWKNFLETQRALGREMNHIESKIGGFVTAIELNGLLYREGLNLLELQRDIRQAKLLFDQIPEIERLTREMVSGWDNLDSLIELLVSFGD